MTSEGFEIGDRVYWKSQAGGNWKEKHGKVVEIIAPHKIPKLRGVGLMGRKERSYVVEVGSRLYWPRTSVLRYAGIARISVTGLKRKYPHPITAKVGTLGVKEDYCVGGALCREVGMEYAPNFPNDYVVWEAIQRVNPLVNSPEVPEHVRDALYDKVKVLTHANDDGDFKLTWRTLGELLRWRPA